MEKGYGFLLLCKDVMFPVPNLEVDSAASLFMNILQGNGKTRLILKWYSEEGSEHGLWSPAASEGFQLCHGRMAP